MTEAIEGQRLQPEMPVDKLRERQTSPEQTQLKTACKEFEGMLLGIILKQGLQASLDDEEDAGGGGILKEFAAEQMARSLGQEGSMGIADMMYRQIAGINEYAQQQKED